MYIFCSTNINCWTNIISILLVVILAHFNIYLVIVKFDFYCFVITLFNFKYCLSSNTIHEYFRRTIYLRRSVLIVVLFLYVSCFWFIFHLFIFIVIFLNENKLLLKFIYFICILKRTLIVHSSVFIVARYSYRIRCKLQEGVPHHSGIIYVMSQDHREGI